MKAATLLLAAALLYACGGSRHRVTVEAVADAAYRFSISTGNSVVPPAPPSNG